MDAEMMTDLLYPVIVNGTDEDTIEYVEYFGDTALLVTTKSGDAFVISVEAE